MQFNAQVELLIFYRHKMDFKAALTLENIKIERKNSKFKYCKTKI